MANTSIIVVTIFNFVSYTFTLVTSYWFSVSAVPGSMIAFATRETIIQVGISFMELSSNVLWSGALVQGARGSHI